MCRARSTVKNFKYSSFFLLFYEKGELTINYTIVFILALLVLIVIALIFRAQIINFVKEITGVSQNLNLADAAKELKS